MMQKLIYVRYVVPAGWETSMTMHIFLQTNMTKHKLLISCDWHWHS